MRHADLPKASNSHGAKSSNAFSNQLTSYPDTDQPLDRRNSQLTSRQLVYPFGSESAAPHSTARNTASLHLLKRRLLEYDLQTLLLREKKNNEHSYKPKISTMTQTSAFDDRHRQENSHKTRLHSKNYSISRLQADRPESRSPATSASHTNHSRTIAPFHRKYNSDSRFQQTVRYANEEDGITSTPQTEDRFILPQFKSFLKPTLEAPIKQVTRVFPSHV